MNINFIIFYPSISSIWPYKLKKNLATSTDTSPSIKKDFLPRKNIETIDNSVAGFPQHIS